MTQTYFVVSGQARAAQLPSTQRDVLKLCWKTREERRGKVRFRFQCEEGKYLYRSSSCEVASLDSREGRGSWSNKSMQEGHHMCLSPPLLLLPCNAMPYLNAICLGAGEIFRHRVMDGKRWRYCCRAARLVMRFMLIRGEVLQQQVRTAW